MKPSVILVTSLNVMFILFDQLSVEGSNLSVVEAVQLYSSYNEEKLPEEGYGSMTHKHDKPKNPDFYDSGDNTVIGDEGQGRIELKAPNDRPNSQSPSSRLATTASTIDSQPPQASIHSVLIERSAPSRCSPRNLQARSPVHGLNENDLILYDDDRIDNSYVQRTEQPMSQLTLNKPLERYDPNNRGFTNTLDRGFENPALVNGFLGWVGSNWNALMNYMGTTKGPSESGTLMAELAAANINYVTQGLPQALMEGLSEKQRRNEVINLEQRERLKRREYDERRTQRTQPHPLDPPPTTVGPYDHEYNHGFGNGPNVEGMGIRIINDAGETNNAYGFSIQELPKVQQQQPWIDPSLPIQEQLYYQQLLYEQQQEPQRGMTTLGQHGSSRNKARSHSRRTEKEQRKLQRHMIADILTDIATKAF